MIPQSQLKMKTQFWIIFQEKITAGFVAATSKKKYLFLAENYKLLNKSGY
jgi:hypothetical protein